MSTNVTSARAWVVMDVCPRELIAVVGIGVVGRIRELAICRVHKRCVQKQNIIV